MQKKIFPTLTVFAVFCLLLCAFKIDYQSSVKSLTHPYINTYVCTQARLGDEDLLEKYEYFKITFLDTKELEVSFKRIGGKEHSYTCPYSYNDKTREFSAEIGILGFNFRQSTTIENGKFSISMPIFTKQLFMLFEVK
ncbi:MAG: hypothetical protein ACI4MH_02415 [Candidatus Coproplasma sp.]